MPIIFQLCSAKHGQVYCCKATLRAPEAQCLTYLGLRHPATCQPALPGSAGLWSQQFTGLAPVTRRPARISVLYYF